MIAMIISSAVRTIIFTKGLIMGNMNKYTDEIDAMDIIWTILRKWRLLIIFMVIGGVVFGACKLFKDMSFVNNQEAIQKKQDEYNKSLEEYEKQRKYLENKRDSLNESIEEVEYEEQNCYILTVNPYNVNKRIIIYYIDSGYEIIPSLSYQNINYNSTIASIYSTALSNTDFDFIVRTGKEDQTTIMNPVNSSYKYQLIDISTGESGNVLKVSIAGFDISKEEQITEEVNRVIKDVYSVINQKIKEHTISIVDIKDSTISEPSIKSVQDIFTNKRDQLYLDIEKTEEQIDQLQEPEKPDYKIKVNWKWVLLGSFGGLVFISLIVFFKAISGKTLSIQDYKTKLNLNIIGTIETKKNNRLDKWLLRKIGFYSTDNEAAEKDFIISSNSDIRSDSRLIIVGSVDKEHLETINSIFSTLCESVIVHSLLSVEGIEVLKTSDMVILVDRVFYSNLDSLALQREIIEKYKKNLYGVVVID